MAGPIALATLLARQQTVIKCPHCGFQKLIVKKNAAAYRVCPKCKKQVADPLARARKK